MMRKIAYIFLAFVFVSVGFLSVGCKNPTVPISIYYMNGSDVRIIKAKKDSVLNLPNLTNAYLDFDGWYANRNYTVAFDSNKELGATSKIYAKWKNKAVEFDGSEKVCADLQKLIYFLEQNGINGKNAQISALQYIRSGRESYCTDEWITFCGQISSEAKSLIQDQQEIGRLIEQNTIEYDDVNIDFLHFAATLNAMLRTDATTQTALLCGFMGDLAQVAIDVNKFASQNQYDRAKDIIGASDGVFSEDDFFADVFAAVVATRFQKSNKTIAELLGTCLTCSKSTIVREFANIYFSQLTVDYVSGVVKRNFNDQLLNIWIEANGETSAEAINHTSTAFAEYLVSFIN